MMNPLSKVSFERYDNEDHILVSENYPVKTMKCTICLCIIHSHYSNFTRRLNFHKKHKECTIT